MAKGDQKQQAANTNQLQGTLSGNSQNLWDQYNTAAGTAGTDYNSIMQGYRNFAANPFGNPNAMGGNVLQPNSTGGSNTGGAPINLGSSPADSNTVAAFVKAHGITDPGLVNYYVTQINSKSDGLQSGNADYWSQKIAQDPSLGGSGGSGGFGGFNSAAYGGYQNFANGGGQIAFDPEFRGALSSALAGYGSFASDGGFSPQAIQDIRARAIGPTRSIYSSAQANIDRQRALQGGFSPNYTAATAKLTRDLSSQISDANVNADASIAQMIQQGKEFGISGQGNVGLQGGGLQAQIDQFNKNLQLQGLAGMSGLDEFGANLGYNYDALNQAKQIAGAQLSLGGLQGASSLYSATPGQASMFLNGALNSQGQQVNLQGQANNLATQQQGFPYAQTISGIGTGIGAASQIAGMGGAGTAANIGTNAAMTGAGGGAIGGDIAGAGGTAAALSPADAAIAAGPAATGISAGASPALAGTTGAGVGSGSSAGSALSGAGGYAAGIGIPAGIMAGINSYTGGPSPYSTGNSPLGIFGGGAGNVDPYSIQHDQQTASDLLNQYGPDSPLYVQFIGSHPWATGGNGSYGAPDNSDYSALAARQG
jgi:hypothetical protein